MARILLVDDDAAVRQTLLTGLRAAGHDVVDVADGLKALAAMKQGAFDLVVTDIVMPNADGIETILKLRRLQPDLPLIAMSGGGRAGDGEYLGIATKFGAVATLAKPFSPRRLVELVASVLAGARAAARPE